VQVKDTTDDEEEVNSEEVNRADEEQVPATKVTIGSLDKNNETVSTN
jgi:hypothetical protein